MTQRERQEHAKKTIFQAALAEFGAQPYDPVTMDRICSRHGISKGMMYHYFSSKDELFLLCVKELFQSLQAYIQEESTQIQKENSHAAIRQYFMLRERFFAREPAWEVIFESAMVHMPEHLRADILELRRPVREMNRRFLQEVIAEMSLRPAVKAEHAARYLESLECVFRRILEQYCAKDDPTDARSMLAAAEEVLDMLLLGILKR